MKVGIKVSFLDGKLSGRVSAFELQKRGGVRYSFYVPNPSRARFNPDEPITAAMPVGTAASPRDLRRFMEFMGLYDSASGQFLQNPNSLPGVERVTVAGTVYFLFPFGDPNNPGFYDAASNSAPAGYGVDLLNFIQHARELDAAGVGFGVPEYMWAYVGNQPGEDRGAYHNFNEESRGFEVRLPVEPVSDWQMIFSYTYNTVEISQAMAGLVDQEIVTGVEPLAVYRDYGQFGVLPSLIRKFSNNMNYVYPSNARVLLELEPMLNLYAYAEDPEMRAIAEASLLYHFGTLALGSFKEVILPPWSRHSQTMDVNISSVYSQFLLWLVYGQGNIEAGRQFDSSLPLIFSPSRIGDRCHCSWTSCSDGWISPPPS